MHLQDVEMYLISEHQQILQTENEHANGRQKVRFPTQIYIICTFSHVAHSTVSPI